MQIRALPGSHVIEVGRLSVESMKNITSPTLQDVINRGNILKVGMVELHRQVQAGICVKNMCQGMYSICASVCVCVCA